MKIQVLITKKSSAYELIDSGGGRKLERYGDVVFSRPDPQALWSIEKPESIWKKAQAVFIRKGKHTEWNIKETVPKKWPLEFLGLTFSIRPTSFKHLGLFPEQSQNWIWIEEKIEQQVAKNKQVNVLNLFGYTGGATLVSLRAGASVTHVDSSKVAVMWAKENAELSNLREKPVRFITDDAILFLKREIKRGNKYDAIIMDPPAFGHGPSGELWKIEEQFTELIELCKKVLTRDPIFFLVSGYASLYSPMTYANSLATITKDFSGTIEFGELALQESDTERLLPAGIFARWSK